VRKPALFGASSVTVRRTTLSATSVIADSPAALMAVTVATKRPAA
jgi:hypothetical protein